MAIVVRVARDFAAISQSAAPLFHLLRSRINNPYNRDLCKRPLNSLSLSSPYRERVERGRFAPPKNPCCGQFGTCKVPHN